MDTTTLDIVGRLVTPQNIGMSAVLWLILDLLRRLLPEVFKNARFRKILPVLPETVGALAYWLVPALAAPGATIAERIMVGIVVGTGSSKVRKIIDQSILGKDAHIPKKAKKEKADKVDKADADAAKDKEKDDKKPADKE